MSLFGGIDTELMFRGSLGLLDPWASRILGPPGSLGLLVPWVSRILGLPGSGSLLFDRIRILSSSREKKLGRTLISTVL